MISRWEKPRQTLRILVAASAALWLSLAGAGRVAAQLPGSAPVQNIGVNPSLLKNVGLDQKLNRRIPLNLIFRDEQGKPIALSALFGRKPVILTLVYYQCPMLCTEVLNGLVRGMRETQLELGKDYSVVTVSIDPKEGPELASVKHGVYTKLYARPGGEQGWRFLTGDETSIKRLADAVGFHYAYDPASGQFAHPSGIMVLTPDGLLSKYFYGISYSERDLRLGLVEASSGKIGSPVDQILLTCFHYDANTGRYDLLISRVIQISGGITVLGMALLIMVLFRREHYGLRGGSAKSAN